VRGEAGSAVPDGSPIRLRRSRRTPSSQSARSAGVTRGLSICRCTTAS
jgi:hypothetical protein